MENNTPNNIMMGGEKKKSGLMIIILIVILLAIVALIYIKKMQKVPAPTQSEMDLNKAVEVDTTASIKTSLDNIDLSDPSSEDMRSVDVELQNL